MFLHAVLRFLCLLVSVRTMHLPQYPNPSILVDTKPQSHCQLSATYHAISQASRVPWKVPKQIPSHYLTLRTKAQWSLVSLFSASCRWPLVEIYKLRERKKRRISVARRPNTRTHTILLPDIGFKGNSELSTGTARHEVHSEDLWYEMDRKETRHEMGGGNTKHKADDKATILEL